MRKITAGLFITLDGVVEAPEKWNPPYYDDEMSQAVMPSESVTGQDSLPRQGRLACRSRIVTSVIPALSHA